MPEDLELQMPTDLRQDTTSQHSVSAGDAMYELLDDAPVEPKRKGVLRFTVDVPVQPSSRQAIERRPPSRWRTPEFIFYGVCFVLVVPLLIWKPTDLSQENHPNYALYSHKLSEGWLFGRKIDNSDSQYHTFRNNIPTLTLISGIFFLLKFAYEHIAQGSKTPLTDRLHRIPFLVAFSFVFLLGLHGSNAPKVLLILTVNYWIAKSLGSSKLSPPLTWLFNICVLFAIDRYDGFPYGSLMDSLSFMDSFRGAYARWYIPFNITMLRLVSFNMDYYWACRRIGFSETEPVVTYRQRITKYHDLDAYTFANFCAYVLYPPLYLAGPIMTFNDFMWQHRHSTFVPSGKTVATYTIRFLGCLLTMEFIQHFMYVVAIKDSLAWKGDSPFELGMIGLWNLMIVWLKLLLPWRFFRLWALADGMDPPENMVRCVLNNYSTMAFWRAWHRSFNLWLIRYIYIPIGGSKNRIVAFGLIFTFVALWHDLTFRLLAWGWLVTIFILPEVTTRYLLPPSKYAANAWYRHVCAVGGVGNLLMMIIANLVGFVIGVDGVKYFIAQLIGTSKGLQFFTVGCVCIFITVQVMFEYREEEMRSGIFRKC